MLEIPAPLRALSGYAQFVIYKLVANENKTDKFPVNSQGKIVSAHDPSNWLSADSAVAGAAALGDGYGVGFSFTSRDPFFFVDIDHCLINGVWSDVANGMVARFPGAAVEVSQSGTGLHIIGQYAGEEIDHACKNTPLGLEFYTSGRFVALTGTHIVGDAGSDHTATLTDISKIFFPRGDVGESGDEFNWSDTIADNTNPLRDDKILIEKALKSKGAAGIFGGKATFKDLWTGDAEKLAACFPDNGGQERSYDASSADAALSQHLIFWTAGDCERAERLIRQSALFRPKWDIHPSYMKRTIGGARGRANAFYGQAAPVEDIEPTEAGAVLREGYQLLSPPAQIEYFKGCIYIAELHKVFTPNGQALKSEQFNAMYGGYCFSLDSMGDKTTKKAWEAFTESQAVQFEKADKFCFRPMIPTGHIVSEEGLKLVNTYVPANVDIRRGDVEPFLTHLAKLLPNERDQTILLSFMAACVQYKGFKIQWAPLLQGVEGNGKTLFTRCVAYAVGERYTHMPPASEIAEKFNSWLFNTLFIGVEDIYVPNEKREILEILKPMITADRLARRAMQTDQAMHDVCCNFIFNSNHKDAIKKTLNDRRYCVFYTAQQHINDIRRDGMAGNYFPEIYEWLNASGYAFVADYLQNYPIPDEFNPTKRCQRAPETTSTGEAINLSLGSVEQEIIEAIEEGKPGFCGGYVSSIRLDALITDMRRGGSIPRNKRREMMQGLGYDWHPALTGGRLNNAIAYDSGKPRIFIKNGHPDNILANSAEVARAYCAAQGDPLAKAA